MMVWPSFAFDRTGAAVIFAVMVTVNTFDSRQSSVSEEAAKVSDTGLVWAAPSTVITPDENRLSTELEPAVNLPMTALVVFRPVMVALVDAKVVIVPLVAVMFVTTKVDADRFVIAPLTPRMVELAVVPMVVPVMVVIDALP